ncbi:MAG: M14 family metallopeptidase [Chitinophagaceae bacterium]
MVRKLLLAVAFMVFIFSARGQLKSPEEFLGYRIGTRFTPHWKIVNYFNHAAANASSMMKLQQYGETNEGRPLLLAVVSSPENIKNLEQIRMNNLRLANLTKDRMAPQEDNAPAIVWLSYNVHGNEPSSSEASLLTLYALTNPGDPRTKEWLKNTVVIIDPCINPDGRDRYVNWFNTAVGKKPNPQPLAREHREPWPQGRTNHYNFDLNRDWAWQTQVESQQRIKKYDEWMPQVHVDYHEQGYNEPYYFAPAAEPFHEVITPWQREFQTSIGKNHAKYFDRNSWLFFTREVFDLFYPSYGDTYPIYNGAIGMTYEQGGISAGLGVMTDEKDTLTLEDRAMHHFTTSLSTIEVSSVHANRLVKEFRKYFNTAVSNGYGEYKSYVIKYQAADAQRIDRLLELLDKNGIAYGTGPGNGKGMSYQTGKEETFSLGANDIVISAYQPRSALARVLFEPKSKLSDSVTYDITAWSLPYVYGLTAWASRDKIAQLPRNGSSFTNAGTEYGYVIPWNGVQTIKMIAQLLKKGILLRYAESPFEINGNKFDRGAVILLKTSNKQFGNNLWTIVREAADANKIQLYPVSSGFVDKGFDFGSDKVHPLKAPRVVMATGDAIGSTAAGAIWHFFENEIDYPLTQVIVTDLDRLNWNEVDVLIMPDGNYRFLSNKDDFEAFKSWINRGGRVIALEGAVAQLAKAEIGIKLKKPEEADKKDDKTNYGALKNYEDRERAAVSGGTPGAIWKVELDNSHPLAFGYPDYYYTLKMDDNVYEFLKEGWNVGVIKKENQVAGFVGAALQPKLKDGLLFGVQNMGSGSVTYLADNVIFRSFWENGKLMLCNAVFLVGQ